MATLNQAEAKRARASKHAQRAHHCTCGRVVYGNGGWSSHKRWCVEAQLHEVDNMRSLLADNPNAVIADDWMVRLDNALRRIKEYWPHRLEDAGGSMSTDGEGGE